MTKQKLNKILAYGPWIEEEAPASFFLIDHFKTCYLDSIYAHKKKFFRTCIYLVDHGYAYEWTPKEDAEKILHWLQLKQGKNASFLRKKDTYFAKVYKETRLFSDQVKSMDLSTVSDQELFALFERASRFSRTQYGYSLITEAADVLGESDFLKLLGHIDAKQIPDVVRKLSLPTTKSFLDEYHELLAEAALILRKTYPRKRPTSIDHVDKKKVRYAVRRLTRSFYWIDNTFKVAKSLTDEDMYKRARQKSFEPAKLLHIEIKKLQEKIQRLKLDQQKIRKQFRIPKRAKSLFSILQYLTHLQDRRKELVLRFGATLSLIFDEASRRSGVPRSEIEFYLIEEMERFLQTGKRIPKKKIEQRSTTLSIAYYKGNKPVAEYFLRKDAKKIFQRFVEERKKLHGQALKGFVASFGDCGELVKGKVKIIFDPEHGHLKPGEILVTGMTRPEFVPLMKKAKAVITNEGGITTHAAIVSRELNKPCIIGTKFATDILKNGDSIFMNMQTGSIEKHPKR